MKHLKTAWQHIRRSPYQAMVAIMTMTLTFYLASLFVLLIGASQTILHYFESLPQVTAFLKDEVKMNQVDQIKAKLESTGKVSQIKYVSKEEALEIYREQNKDDPALLEMVTANILPASLEVSTREIGHLKEVSQILKEESGIQEVIFQEDVVSSLQVWTSNIRKAGIELVGSLAFISFLLISVITGMKVVLRREEIEILQLIGATSWYIRLPFIFEGIFYGMVGAILGWGLAYLRLLYLAPTLVAFLKDTPVPPIPTPVVMLTLLGGEMALGILIGILGSFLALTRYLK